MGCGIKPPPKPVGIGGMGGRGPVYPPPRLWPKPVACACNPPWSPYPVGWAESEVNSWLLDCCGCGCWIVGTFCELWFNGSSNLGALLAGVERPARSSATPNEIMSTMLETSFLTRSGSELGRSLPVNFRLHRYMARANSGKRSWPDLVVSESVLS